MSKAKPIVVNKHNAPHATWGNNCHAWSLLASQGLSIKLECMPQGSEEVLHFHNQAQQFFYILKGKAIFEIDGTLIIVHEGEGITIEPAQQHRIVNRENGLLEFLICSQPSTQNDRINIV